MKEADSSDTTASRKAPCLSQPGWHGPQRRLVRATRRGSGHRARPRLRCTRPYERRVDRASNEGSANAVKASESRLRAISTNRITMMSFYLKNHYTLGYRGNAARASVSYLARHASRV